MLTKEEKTRIMKLVEFMESLPKPAKKTKELYTCGTTMCIPGWATTMPYFRRLGL